jgi:hypothetical protein
MFALFFHQEIARQRQADRLRGAAQERLARAARLAPKPAAPVEWARLARLLHLRRPPEVAAESAPVPTARA